jgi:hypothetical protein
MALNCEMCGSILTNRKDRYCPPCTKVMRRRMRESGYLQSAHVPPYFSDERGRKGLRDTRVLGGEPY